MAAYTPHEIFADNAADYLDKNNVYELFSYLLKDLVVAKPADPLAHMISLLERPVELLKVVIFGAPGSGQEVQTSRLVQTFGMVHLRVSNLLDEEVENKTPLGAKVKSFQEQGLTVTDGVITSIIESRLQKSDCRSKGWLLDGYPTTAAQVHSLQLSGIMCNKVVVLEASTAVCKKRATESEIYVDLAAKEFDGLFETYDRHIKQIVPLYPTDVCQFLDATDSEEQVWDSLKAFCVLPPVSKAPRRPMRVCMLGATGAGKQTQCVRMAHRHGLVHISTGSLLRDEMEKNAELKKELSAFIEAGALVSDEIVTGIVTRRLLQKDCRTRGWLLDGFPRTVKQGQALATAHLAPNRVIVLDVTQTESEQRCMPRRVDSNTGDLYFVSADLPPPPAAVAPHLTTQLKDTVHVHKTLFITYQAEIDELLSMYKDVLRRVDASKAIDSVYDEIERFYLQSLGARTFNV